MDQRIESFLADVLALAGEVGMAAEGARQQWFPSIPAHAAGPDP
jgi:hypothetical protein